MLGFRTSGSGAMGAGAEGGSMKEMAGLGGT